MSERFDLSYLIKHMNPIMHKGDFVFSEVETDLQSVLTLEPVSFTSFNGKYSVVLPKQTADNNNIKYHQVYNMISVSVTPSPEESEFLAVISGVFADQGIKANFISSVSNHLLFVSAEKKDDAMQLLIDLTIDF